MKKSATKSPCSCGTKQQATSCNGKCGEGSCCSLGQNRHPGCVGANPCPSCGV